MPQPDYRNADPAIAYPRALAAMRNPAFFRTPKYQEQQTRALREGAHPLILEFADKMVKAMKGLLIPVFPHCIVRTYEDQASAYVTGVSRDSPEDGLFPHMAFAVDIIHCNLGWMDKPVVPHAWDVIGHMGKEVAHSMGIDITWGGDWKFYDPAHFELTEWREIAALGDKHWVPKVPVVAMKGVLNGR